MLPDGTMVIGSTKAQSDRVLAIPIVVIEALKDHKVLQATERLAAPAWEDHSATGFFATRFGKPLDPSNLRREVTRLCHKAEIEPITPYELRHSAASLLVAGRAALSKKLQICSGTTSGCLLRFIAIG